MDEEIREAMESYLAVAEVEQLAKMRYSSALPRAASRRSRYEVLHGYYAPIDGDQWAEDRFQRPGKLHVTANIVRAFVDTEARLLSIPPRITNKPDARDLATQKRAEACEELFLRWLEASGWEVWMSDLNRGKGIYGLGYLKPYWNERENRPDVIQIEQPQNLMVGYATNDFNSFDWAIYAYKVSAIEAKIRFPGIEIHAQKGKEPLVFRAGTDHEDPLRQRGIMGGVLSTVTSVVRRNPTQSDYEMSHIDVWDYWYRDEKGGIYNCTLLAGTIVDGPHYHPELPIIPYIPIEHDHEPGSPEGLSTAETLIDLQNGLNRAIAQFAQHVADDTEPAWQLVGENAESVPEGIVPKANEIIAAGSGNEIKPIEKTVNQFPIQQLIQEYRQTAHLVTGLPEILFGNLPNAQSSGRAMAVQIEAAANRLESKRKRLYEGIRALLMVWGFMVEKKELTVKISQAPEASDEALAEAPALEPQEIKLADIIKGLNRWKIVAPEITPRDEIEHTQNTINKVNSKLMPLEWAMDEVGIENPQEAIAMIERERSNARLFPADAQAQAAVASTVQAIQQAEAAQDAANAQAQANNGTAAQAGAQAAAQQAAPSQFEDQNQPQPMTQAGSAPPPGAPAPIGGELQPLVRQTPGGESQSMSQIVMPKTGF